VTPPDSAHEVPRSRLRTFRWATSSREGQLAEPFSLGRGIALGSVAVLALTLPKLAFIDVIGRPTPFLLYFAATLVAAWTGGIRAGLVVTALSAALGAFGFIPHPFALFWGRTLPQLCIFVAEGLAISYVTSRFAVKRQAALVAAREQRATADRLNLVLGGLGEGITVLDAAGKLVFANELAAALCGCESAEEMMRLSARELVERFDMFDLEGNPFSSDRLPSRRVYAGEAPEPVEIRFRLRNGGPDRYSRVRANALTDDEGKIMFVVNVFNDVTALHWHDAQLTLSREWFHAALRSIGDAVIATDARGRISLMNSISETLTGFSSAEALGRPLSEVFRIINEESREAMESPVDRVIREGKIVGLANHTLLLRPDGTEIAVDDSAAPIHGISRELEGVILVFRDVNEKRAKERRTIFLEGATRQLSSSLDYKATLATVARLAVPLIADWCAVDIVEDGQTKRLAVAHVDPSKVEWVREVERRYPPDPNAPNGVANILRTGREEMMADIPESLLEAAAQDEEHRRIIKMLELRSYIGVPLLREGKAFGVITLVLAESKRRYGADDLALALALADRASVAVENARLFRDAEQARSEAVRANRAKDEFLAVLGHELRNPLAPIRAAIELIRRRPGDAHEREHGVIERQVDHVQRLIDDLLDVSRITRGRVSLTQASVDIAQAIENARELVWPAGKEPDQRVTIDVPKNLCVQGDPLRLAQVFVNLLSNAEKYTKKGGHIWVEGRRAADRIEVRVRDDGMGIGPETLQHVFELFVQEPQAIDRARGGLGLGLAIVQGLVRAHGGTVSALSEGKDRGAEFIVSLPACDVSRVPDPATEVRAPQPRPARILIVDDNRDALELMALLLTQLGHSPVTASTPSEALAVAARDHFEFALLDIGLPEMDGYELGRRLRVLDGLDHLHLIALTGYGQDNDRSRSAAAGFAAHLVKPVDLDELLRTMERLGG
jgi:PAS domain S-box-containing protein